MSFSFDSHAGTGNSICGHNDHDAQGNPAGGYAVDTDSKRSEVHDYGISS